LKIYAVLNQKGGVGKTTTAANLAAGLALAGRAVLAVDADPQAGLTASLLGAQAGAGLYEVLTGKADAAEAIIPEILQPLKRGGSLALLPATIDLAAAEIELQAVPGRERILAEALGKLRGFETCLIDLPPSLSILSILGMTAAGGLIIPVQCEALALAALGRLMESVAMIRRGLNPKLEIFGILPTRFDARRRLNLEALARLREHFPGQVFKTIIRENVSLAEAAGHGRPIFTYRAGSHGAADYADLVKEFMRREREEK
jgi:chromosome partitioning protein